MGEAQQVGEVKSFAQMAIVHGPTITPIEALEAAIHRAVNEKPEIFALAHMPLVHTFTPGLYSRQISMPKGTLVCSKTHKTEHQFVLSEGVISYWTNEGKEVIVAAPFHGVTKPGTTRALYIHEDSVWTTFHSTLLQTPEEIIEDITETYENRILDGHYLNNVFYPANKELDNIKNDQSCLLLQ